ncbi:hypothetical protein TIFTF001_040812 [Ficus carica]|uniref:Uncharacterized protein n=1 Tax=Ficus carica TaxID=3494 RepID=A0AA87YXY3_FICCA|nr:hypothetical protein TIFTF001_040812 [Ficus carica]
MEPLRPNLGLKVKPPHFSPIASSKSTVPISPFSYSRRFPSSNCRLSFNRRLSSFSSNLQCFRRSVVTSEEDLPDTPPSRAARTPTPQENHPYMSRVQNKTNKKNPNRRERRRDARQRERPLLAGLHGGSAACRQAHDGENADNPTMRPPPTSTQRHPPPPKSRRACIATSDLQANGGGNLLANVASFPASTISRAEPPW